MRQKQPRKALSQAKYRKLCEYISERDGYCVFCGKPGQPTPAHIIRRSAGGHDAPNNMVRACIECHDLFDQYRIVLPGGVAEMLASEAASF